jgi:hypothetical protein
MIGTPLIGAVVAQLAFWVLLVLGIARGSFTKFGAAVFILLWLAGYIGLPRIAWWTAPFVTSWVAALDIALVFIVYRGDVKLSAR